MKMDHQVFIIIVFVVMSFVLFGKTKASIREQRKRTNQCSGSFTARLDLFACAFFIAFCARWAEKDCGRKSILLERSISAVWTYTIARTHFSTFFKIYTCTSMQLNLRNVTYQFSNFDKFSRFSQVNACKFSLNSPIFDAMFTAFHRVLGNC